MRRKLLGVTLAVLMACLHFPSVSSAHVSDNTIQNRELLSRIIPHHIKAMSCKPSSVRSSERVMFAQLRELCTRSCVAKLRACNDAANSDGRGVPSIECNNQYFMCLESCPGG